MNENQQTDEAQIVMDCFWDLMKKKHLFNLNSESQINRACREYALSFGFSSFREMKRKMKKDINRRLNEGQPANFLMNGFAEVINNGDKGYFIRRGMT